MNAHLIQAAVAGVTADPKINKNNRADTEIVPRNVLTVLTAFAEVTHLNFTTALHKESIIRIPCHR